MNRKCKICKEPARRTTTKYNWAHCGNPECAFKLHQMTVERHNKEESRKFKAETKRRKKALRSRTEWFDILQVLVNQYVLYRDRNEPCCTCGTTKPDVKYDAGHYRSRGACQELRFELTNIHKQCSVTCNVHGSGKRAEYNEFIKEKYGEDHYNWLIGPHPTLKEQFPHWEDIEKECQRYRKLLREVGIKPNK